MEAAVEKEAAAFAAALDAMMVCCFKGGIEIMLKEWRKIITDPNSRDKVCYL